MPKPKKYRIRKHRGPNGRWMVYDPNGVHVRAYFEWRSALGYVKSMIGPEEKTDAT